VDADSLRLWDHGRGTGADVDVLQAAGALFARVARTNAGLAALVLLALVAYWPMSDSIPANGGLGYDGVRYAQWVADLPLHILPDGPRPPYLTSDLDSYAARRFLPSALIHAAMAGLDVDPSPANVVTAFALGNLLLLGLTLYLWGRIADAAGLATRAKWIGVLALQVSYANWKMPFFYPVLTDTFALALGASSLLFYLERRTLGQIAVMVASAFVWPTLPYFSALLLAFPAPALEAAASEDERGPRGWKTLRNVTAAGAALVAVALAVVLVRAGYRMPNTPVRPLASLLAASALFTALYLFFGLRALLSAPRVWADLVPRRALGRPRLWLAALLVAGLEAIVAAIAVAEGDYSGMRFVTDTFFSSVTQPGVFYVAHVLFFGPLLVLVPFLWRPMCRAVERRGTGLVLCFALAVLIGAGSESRKLMNFYPFLVLVLAEQADRSLRDWRPIGLMAALSVLVSKVWLPMGQDLDLPLLGTVGWRTLYVSSRGPWIDHGSYVFQGALVAVLTVVAYRWLSAAKADAVWPTKASQPRPHPPMLGATPALR
jgi:hypothetical protein